jgi:hypothetical protein
MAELKTKRTEASVERFLKNIKDERRRMDCIALVDIMRRITKSEPKMWGPSIVGFGSYHFVYESGREGDWFLTGFSPRKEALTLYVMSGFAQHGDAMKTLGKCKTGKGCLYVKALEDIHLPSLKKLLRESVTHLLNRSR